MSTSYPPPHNPGFEADHPLARAFRSSQDDSRLYSERRGANAESRALQRALEQWDS